MAAKSNPASHWLIPVVVAVFLFLTAVFSKPFRYSAADLVMLAVLYGLLALAIYLPALIAVQWGRLPALVGALATAFILVLHYREQTRPSGTAESLDKPEVLAVFALTWVLVAVLYYFATRALCPRDIGLRSGIMLMGVMPLFLGVLTISYYASTTFRWHLLRHNTLLGAASYHLLADDTASVRDALWEGNAAMSPVPTSDAEGASARAGEPFDAPVSAVGESAVAQASGSAPNIVFVLIDALRADALAAYGGEVELMPFLNAFAEQSFVFTDVKANSSWTFPSMASFFTGLLPEEHGAVWESSLSADKWTLAEAMAARGYRTAAFVSNGVAVREDRGMAQGFEEFHQLGTRGAMYPRAGEMNDAVFEWLQRHRADAAAGQPVFLYVHYLDPHVPYLAAGVVDPASHEEAMEAYDTELRYLDDQLRRLVEGLEAQLDAPTYTFMVSDHGEEFGEHGERGHGRVLYDEVLRIPALLHLDGTATPGRIDDKLEGRDFFDLLNVLAATENVDIPAWAGAHARSERYAATYYSNRSSIYRLLRPYRADICLQAIEKDGYVLIWSGQGNTYELYDLRTDPEQLHNLAARQPQTVTRLAAAMKAAPSYWSPRISQVFNADEIERLRALGYLR